MVSKGRGSEQGFVLVSVFILFYLEENLGKEIL